MKILFMGTPDFAKESLENLYNNGYEICGVVTTPDRPSGRGMKLNISPVKEYALEKKLNIFQPEKITNNTEFKDEIKALNPDLVCVVSYGVILPKSFLKIPRLGCINVHPSMLPKYRGSAPIQWAILNGDKKTGVTIMYLNEKMDAGDIIIQKEVEIGEDETTGELWNRLSKIGAELLIESIKNIENGTAVRTVQPEEFTLAPMLTKDMSKIDWKLKTSADIKNLVRGLNPIMGAFSFLNGKKIKFWKVQKISKEEFLEIAKNCEYLDFDKESTGTVLLANEKKGLYIKTNDGIISVLEIQGENSRKMNINDFLRGNKIGLGQIFE
ncbi:MAG TPA: methionyl-tRNA formyltransferase [Candidatus Scatovivens faecipullorum]|nr:methionyl-tRNA formyltransferase [Candidatus Scatovivens faecipullorum]